MHTSVNKLEAALAERGKGSQARKVLGAHGFDPKITDLELRRRVYGVLRALLKEAS